MLVPVTDKNLLVKHQKTISVEFPAISCAPLTWIHNRGKISRFCREIGKSFSARKTFRHEVHLDSTLSQNVLTFHGHDNNQG